VVRELVWLKARLTWNGVRHDVQRRFGFPIATILLGWAGWHLATRLVAATADLDPAALPDFLGWVSLLFFAAWVTLPVVIFPLDENLDPQQLAVLPISHRQMTAGLAVASFVAPAAVVPAIVLGANAFVLRDGWWMVLPASLVYLGVLAVGSQLFSAAISAILRTRRGRDVATFLILGIAAGSFFAYRSISDLVGSSGMEGAVLTHSILDWSLLIPPVAAQRALIEAASGGVVSALIHLAAGIGGLFVLVAVWRRLLTWMLTTPREGSRPAARARRSGFTAGPWGVITTLARKELRFYVRDPRQRLVWTGTVIFVGLAVAGTIMGTTGFFDIRDNDWAPLMAPVLVLFVGLPIALNLFGWERNAASYLFVLPLSPSQMLRGKNLAVALGLLAETALLAILLSLFTGFWNWTWLALPLTVAAIGCQLAVGNIVSVLTPLRLPREGTDVFAQSTEQGCLAIVSQTLSFFTIGLLLVVPASVVTLTVAFNQPLDPWIAAVSAVVWGVGIYSLSLWVASKLLRRRLPEVMAWVQVV
jgi:ABC-2 type transport system permease protein